jgi:5'-methylthioadenosine phosphorylase
VGRLAIAGKRHTLGDPRNGDRPAMAKVPVVERDDHVVLYRHGVDVYMPPHRVDHVGNMRALVDLGCDRVLAISSVGSLRADVGVGSLVAPDDFIALDQPPISAFDDERQHVVPSLTPAWRARVLASWSRLADMTPVDGGVYWQVTGPRFETPAEIRLIGEVADVVGMTMASECVAACQVGLEYAAICVVDNLANGVGPAPLTLEEYERGQRANRAMLEAALAATVPELAAAP